MSKIDFAVFTKMWNLSTPDLARHIAGLGFDSVELPVRPGYAVSPENVATELPRAARIFADHGLQISSIAGPLDRTICDDTTLAACSAAGVPIMRVCLRMRSGERYMQGEARLKREHDAFAPLLEKHGIVFGIQNHCDTGSGDVCNAMGVLHLVEARDPKQFGIVWDAGHSGLEGEPPETGIDIAWSHLCMVNLKSAYWRRSNGPEAPVAEWQAFWTTGRYGRANWPRAIAELNRRGYSGTVCFPAEYTDEPSVDRLVKDDLDFVRSLLA